MPGKGGATEEREAREASIAASFAVCTENSRAKHLDSTKLRYAFHILNAWRVHTIHSITYRPTAPIGHANQLPFSAGGSYRVGWVIRVDLLLWGQHAWRD
jgi:hypothetical protein